MPLDEYVENYMEVFGHLPDTWRWAECEAGSWPNSRVGSLSQHMLFDGPDNNRLIMTARRYAR
jgi:hypothetical protein